MVWPTVRPGRRRGDWVRGGLSAVATLAFAVALLGCEPSDPARAGAESFIDRYYVEINLPAAREHAVGYAVAKLDREMELLEGIGAAESSGKPHVNYRFLREREGSDAGHRGFLYELTILFEGGGEFVRRTLVSVQEDGSGGWRVANFQEID